MALRFLRGSADSCFGFLVHRHAESSSNFGFKVPWWDRAFGTYREQPHLGHEAMTVGVDAFRSAAELRLDRLLIQPFSNTPGQYPINRRQPAEL